MQLLPNGTADFIRHRPQELRRGVRWITRTPNQVLRSETSRVLRAETSKVLYSETNHVLHADANQVPRSETTVVL